MKVGDKLYCIKRYDRFSIFGTDSFYPGCEYEITFIRDVGHIDYRYIHISFGYCDGEYMLFYINESIYNEHFISLSEHRKIKLKKIDENR